MSKYSSSSARGAAAVFAQNCTEFCEKSVENRGKQRNSPEKDAMSHEYIYIDVELRTLGPAPRVEPVYFKKYILEAVHQLFGETSSSQPLDLIKYDPDIQRGIIRVPSKNYVKVHSSLTLKAEVEGVPSAFHVYQSSHNLLALTSNSKEYFRSLNEKYFNS